jgi:uncharacterized Fe-S cluster-containing radical SAM superfamily protein
MNLIDTDKTSFSLREKAINLEDKSILITNFENSEQKKDLTEPANCNGFGRVRHFRMGEDADWPQNPLPILPASKALGIPPAKEMRAQVFQNAICNWRCWYCFVDFKLLAGNRKYSDFLSSKTLLDYYLEQPNPPKMIDLTGGQPDLTPEWVPWMMEAVAERGLADQIYLWSDDNLSNDYFWQYLSSKQIDAIAANPMYGRVCCFKGMDEASFEHNTGAHGELFHRQFDLWERLLTTGMDLYAYMTLPAATSTDFEGTIARFLDRIQEVDENFPLRMVPLKIQAFTPAVSRIKTLEMDLLEGQDIAINIWTTELQKRFTSERINQSITETKTKYQ